MGTLQVFLLEVAVTQFDIFQNSFHYAYKRVGLFIYLFHWYLIIIHDSGVCGYIFRFYELNLNKLGFLKNPEWTIRNILLHVNRWSRKNVGKGETLTH